MAMSSAMSKASFGLCSTSTMESPLFLELADGRHDLGDDLRRQALPTARPSRAPADWPSARGRWRASAARRRTDDRRAGCGARQGAGTWRTPFARSTAHGGGRRARARAATLRFSRTVRLLNTRRPCGTSATPRAAIGSGGSARHRRAEHFDRAAAWRQQPDGDVHAGRLAGAVAAEQPEQAALAEFERHPLQHMAVAVIGVDVVELERAIRQDRPPGCAGRPRLPRACLRRSPRRNAASVMRSANSSAMSMSCSIITIVTSRGIAASSSLHVAALVDRETGERLVEQQHLWVLRQRHGDLDARAFAVGGLRQRAVGDVIEADARRARRGPSSTRWCWRCSASRDSSAAATARAAPRSHCAGSCRA